jgi:AcrR family transcriptional regulator
MAILQGPLNQTQPLAKRAVYCTVRTVLSIAGLHPDELLKADSGPVKKGVREKILAAAAASARDVGPGNLSLDAVAARAGVSKGGLLYHFPSKSALLEALVGQHLQDFDAALDEKEKAYGGRPNSLAAAYLDLFVAEQAEPPPSGVLAAMAENPGLLVPVSRFKRLLLDRLKAGASDENSVLVLFLAIEGMRSLRLFETDIILPDEREAILTFLAAMLPADPKKPDEATAG